MNELSNSMSSLVDALNPALQKLSEMFCVSVDFIRENAMYYIMEYGKYALAKDIVGDMIFWFVAGFIAWAVVSIVVFIADIDVHEESEVIKKHLKNILIFVSILTFIIMLASFLHCIVPYWISPEMYSIEQVMRLVK